MSAWDYRLAGSGASSLCPSVADLEADGWEHAGTDPRYRSVWMCRSVRRLNSGPVKRTKARRTALRKRREERGLTVGEAAALAGISRSYLRMLEAGTRRITWELRTKLLAVYAGQPVLAEPEPDPDDIPLEEWGRKTA